MKRFFLFATALLFSVFSFAETINIDVTATQLGEKYGWLVSESGEQHDTVKLDGNIIAYATTGKNQGYYYGTDWRLYQARVDSFFIEALNGATLGNIQLTYATKNSGALSSVRGIKIAADKVIASDSVLNVSGQTKVCLYIANTDSIFTGQVRISRFRITYDGVITIEDPTFKFKETDIHKSIRVGNLTNTLTNTSDGVVTYTSSNPAIATVDADGTVTLVSEGEATITAEVSATDNYNAAMASYTVYVHSEKWNMETFDGAEFEGKGTYYTVATSSAKPSNATGITWTAFLGSVRSGMSGFSNTCAVIRQRKSSETDKEMAYLVSDEIAGGIDSIAFRWNSNGKESGNWNIAILVNNDTIGKITEKAGAMFADGAQPYFTKGGLKKSGKFTLRFVNMAEVLGSTDNAKRFCIDNIEWFSYTSQDTPTGVDNAQDNAKARKVVKDGQLYILHNGRYVNILGF